MNEGGAVLRLSAVGDTHVGLVRKVNQDSAFVGPTCILVADGVGGHAAGEVASATTAYAVARAVTRRQGQDPVEVVTGAIARAQTLVAAGADADPDRSGMATTLTALITDGRMFALGHLGDSRGYVFRDDNLVRVTRDHTYVQDLVDEGRLSEKEAAEHPWRNVVLRTVNGHPDAEPDVIALDLRAGDRVLLASDGLTDMVPEAEIAEVLGRRSDDDALAHLISAALARGGRDNVTCVLATVVEGAPVSLDGALIGAVTDPRNVIDLPAVRSSSA